MTIDDQTLALVVLASLDGAGPARLKWLLDSSDSPTQALELLRNKRLKNRPAPQGLNSELVEKWSNQSRRISEGKVVERLVRDQMTVLTPSADCWPIPSDDPDPPVLLFARGDLAALTQPKVAIVGTRRCSSVGRKFARQVGAELSGLGISVVSGLALGIDREAHIGALVSKGSKPIAVLGTGVDVCYPRRNQSLFDELLAKGLVISELPPGTKPRRWQFPARNRIIAGIADATIVVESHLSGGSLLTADESVERGKPVLAVPGSVLSPAAAGTNQLLRDGAELCLDVDSVVETVYGFGVPSKPKESRGDDKGSPLVELILSEARSGSGTLTTVMSAWKGPSDEVFTEVQKLAASREISINGERLGVL